MSRSRPHPNTQPTPPTELPVPCWAEAPAFGRRETLLRALRLLRLLHSEAQTIVETGTLRDDRDQARIGDGWSTLAWGWYASQTGGRMLTIDRDPDAIETCRKCTQPYASSIDYVAADSLVFLKQWQEEQRGPIHLLYLDSLDSTDEHSAQHHLLEAQAALVSLAPTCLVLFDDTEVGKREEERGKRETTPHFTGKGALAVPFLLDQGFRLEWAFGGQVLLSRRAETSSPPATLERGSAARGRTPGQEQKQSSSSPPLPFSPSVFMHDRQKRGAGTGGLPEERPALDG